MKRQRRVQQLVAIVLAVIMVGLVPGPSPASASVTYPFSDNVEDPAAGNWLADSPWGRTTTDSHSGNTSWTDSPGNYYGNNISVSLTLATPLDLSSATNPRLKFWHHYQIEPGFDFGYVEISTNLGANWTTLAAYSGTQSTPFQALASATKSTAEPQSWEQSLAQGSLNEPWVMEQIDLSPYATQTSVKIRFRLVTDGSGVRDGWYIDDIAVAELPTAVTLSAAANITRTSIELNWSRYNGADFTSYVVYRGLKSNVDLRSTRVTAISSQDTTSFTDTGLAPKTPYYYRVYVVSNYEIHSPSNEQSGTTLAGLDYPFYDNMEAGPNNWIAEPSNVWTLVTPDSAHSGNKVWTDSPSGDYGNNVNASLTLVNDININPLSQLVFWHRLKIASGDQALVELSTNGSSNWTALATFTNQQINSWTRLQLDLGDATITARVRFRLVTDGAGTAGGWDIDDVGISDLPTAVTMSAPVPQGAPNIDKIGLSWTQNNDVYFQSYQVYRDTQAGVDLRATLVATITNQSTTSYLDSGLLPNTNYFYLVYVLNPGHAFNGSNEVTATTAAPTPGGVVAYPFSDDMESGTGNWLAGAPWGRVIPTTGAHSGSYAWTDSPVGNYGNNVNISLQINVNLRDAKMPVLTFWQQYTLVTNQDWGFVDASTDGVNWSTIYFVTGSSSWREEKIDLTEYTTYENVRIRFRLWSDGATTADGWYIDDVRIAETTAPTITFPFFDDMESGAETRWLSSSWELGVPLGIPAHSGSYYWDSTTTGAAPGSTQSKLTLAATVNLTGSNHPQLTFWHRYEFGYYNNAYVQISTRKGISGSWTTLREWGGYYPTQNTWVQQQIDLSNYANVGEVRIRFYRWNPNGGGRWYIDDVRISEAPLDVVLSNPTNVTQHGASLSWTANNNTDFARYEIRRDTTADVTLADTLVASITDRATTAYADTFVATNNYYYRIFVFNDKGLYSLGSNVVQAVYPPLPRANYLFFDDMESGTGNWDWNAPWGLVIPTTGAHSGNYSWTDSPAGNYGNNANTSLDMSINLRDAKMPVLTFWQQYTLVTNQDWSYVDASTDGVNWSTIYFVSGSSSWREEKIDLTEYTTYENVRIRFRLWSDGATTADGWYIDDVRIAETTMPTFTYPFFDDIEDVAGTQNRWLSSSWELGVPLGVPAHSGSYYWDSTTTGAAPSGTQSKLTLAATVNLTGSNHPQLTFWHRYELGYYNNAYVQISTRKGISGSWTTLREWGGYYPTQNTWVQEQIDLSNYANVGEVRIRFYRYNPNGGGRWYVDDVRISEAPLDVVLSNPTNVTQHGATLNWTANNNTDFTRSEIRRDTTADVTLADTLVASITSQVTTSYTDTFAVPSYYYYRIYVFNDKGLHSLGSNVVQAVYPAPGRVNFPFFDDMESGTGSWDWSSPWGLVTPTTGAHSGNYSWTDSPMGNYGNNANTSLEMAVNLRDAKMPVLTFWQQYTLVTNQDWGYVEASTDGVNWSTIYFVTGSSSWREERIDLTEYTTFENVRIRFRLWSDGATTADGWYIDDVRIAETTAPTLTYPFFDDIESAPETRWLSSSWELGVPLGVPAHSGSYYWDSTTTGAAPGSTQSKLTLAATVNLTGSNHPQLTFWHRYELGYYNNAYVQISTRKGISGSWTTLREWGGYYPTQNTWVQQQIDLSNYANVGEVRIRFYRWNPNGGGRWYIDDVRISEAPLDVVLSNPTNVSRHGATLSWTANNNTDFTRYEIRRDTTADVTLADTLVASITNQATTSYTDTFAVANYYYYRIFVFNDKGVYSLGSNIVQAVYPPPPRASFPFSDDMESGTGNWDWSSPWGQVIPSTGAHSGNYTWTDSPVGNYGNNANTALEMAVNLRDARIPVLTFWQQYTLVTNQDWGYVDASTDGVNWSTIYFVTDSSSWKEEHIDLTEYATYENVRIRFRLWSDGATTADGWYIDDVRISETAVPTFTYPFFDDMEDAAGTEARWLSSSWELGVPLGIPAHSGRYYWDSTTTGAAPGGTQSKLTLAATVNLTGSNRPQLTFWHRYELGYYNNAYVQISARKGISGSWTTLREWGGYYPTQNTWTWEQIDLSNYANVGEVRIRFYRWNPNGGGRWYIDDVRIDEVDTTAPGAVTNLAVSSVTANSATLTWTAPGDDANVGRAWQYDLRYSTGAITATNWDAATQASGEPAPQPAGSRQSFTVTGLNPVTAYYFAMKTADEVSNWSGLSNVASATTFPAGAVIVTMDAPTHVLTSRNFTAKIKLTQVENFDAASYNVTFDASVLQLVNVTAGLIGSTEIPVGSWNVGSPGNARVVQNVEGTPGVTGAGYLAVLQFYVIGTDGTSSQIGLASGILGDNQGQPILSSWVGDSVRVTTVLPGDANGDEAVNALDLTKTERIIVGLDAATPGADANRDGSINALDLTFIERIIVGLQ